MTTTRIGARASRARPAAAIPTRRSSKTRRRSPPTWVTTSAARSGSEEVDDAGHARRERPSAEQDGPRRLEQHRRGADEEDDEPDGAHARLQPSRQAAVARFARSCAAAPTSLLERQHRTDVPDRFVRTSPRVRARDADRY
jgi:hypothetical protein